MASLITCPHCGTRPMEEFTVKGDASVRRPGPDAGADAWYDYVYTRENPRGPHAEYWHHGGGCRRWLIVERNTLTHDVGSVRDAALSSGEAGR